MSVCFLLSYYLRFPLILTKLQHKNTTLRYLGATTFADRTGLERYGLYNLLINGELRRRIIDEIIFVVYLIILDQENVRFG